MYPVAFVGDIHGYLNTLRHLLVEAGMIDGHGRWTGGRRRLYMVGDLVDRGPQSLETVRFVRELQIEAGSAGGLVESILGNHDALLVAGWRFRDAPSPSPSGSFMEDWIANGGQPEILDDIHDDEIAWLERRPMLALVDDTYLVGHADSLFVTRLGNTIAEVNAEAGDILRSDDVDRWDVLLERFFDRFVFAKDPQAVDQLFRRYGGRIFVHGHTPITNLTGTPSPLVRSALTYAGSRVIDVDGGIYLGSPGFLHLVDA